MAKEIFLDMEFIKFLMEQKGLSVKDLSQKMKLTPATIRRYLNGADQTNMSTIMLFRFAKALDISVIQLLQSEHIKIPT